MIFGFGATARQFKLIRLNASSEHVAESELEFEQFERRTVISCDVDGGGWRPKSAPPKSRTRRAGVKPVARLGVRCGRRWAPIATRLGWLQRGLNCEPN